MAAKNTLWFYISALALVIVDQLTKLIARAGLLEQRPVTLIPGILDLRLAYNPGAAFGVLPDWAPLFILVGLVAIYAIVRLRRVGSGSRLMSVGLGLLLGGAMGNLIDRVSSGGKGVTDFIDLTVKIAGYQWPTFNVADIGIVVGAIMVLLHVYVIEKCRTEEDRSAETGS